MVLPEVPTAPAPPVLGAAAFVKMNFALDAAAAAGAVLVSLGAFSTQPESVIDLAACGELGGAWLLGVWARRPMLMAETIPTNVADQRF